MDNLKTLLNQDLSKNKPKRIGLTDKFLKWNRAQIKLGKTNYYYDKTKVYNLDTNRVNNISKFIDKRNNKLKKSFLNNYNQYQSTISKKDKNILKFRYEIPNDNINNSSLLHDLITDNNIQGKYRLIIKINDNKLIDTDVNINTNNWFWKNRDRFLSQSPYMKWNDPNNIMDGDIVYFIFTKEKKLPFKYYAQKFLDGANHCFFYPIKQYLTERCSQVKSKISKANYQAKINLIDGKQLKNEYKHGLIHLYKDGIPEDKLSEVCEILQIGVIIEQPFNKKKLYEYRSNKKPIKVFNFINTRLNHIEKIDNSINDITDKIYKSYDPINVTKKELLKIHDELQQSNEFMIFTKNLYGISSIKTLDNYYKLDDNFQNTCYEFEKDTGLISCNVDYNQYPELENFIDNGTHFNTTIDFKDTEKYKKEIPKNVNHIDMTKAYTQFKKSKYYNGFMGKITDFRKVNNYKQNGLYYIINVNLDKCNTKFYKLNDMLSWFYSNNIYTDAELRCLHDNGGVFEVTHGCYGTNLDFDFNSDMCNKKDVIQIKENNEIKIPYYAKYTGKISSNPKTKSFYMYGNNDFFNTIQNDVEHEIYTDDNNLGRIEYNKKYRNSKKHIASQIIAYQRLIMLEQLLLMEFDKIIRICVDGIYYENHEYEIMDCFLPKTKMTFNNSPCEEYLSGLIKNNDTRIKLPLAEPREHYLKEIFIGAGGTGKTTINLKDSGFINSIYIPHSWKLSVEQKCIAKSVHYYLFNDNENRLFNFNNVLIIDECSMLTESQKQFIFKTYNKHKIIFLGDVGFQAEPCSIGKEMDTTGFDNVVNMNGIVYRFQDCIKQQELNKKIRFHIKNKIKIDYNKLGLQTITKDELKKEYKVDDMIICFNRDNIYDTMFDYEKYLITNNTRDFKNGTIVFEKPNIACITYKKKHGYTSHSLQGTTISKNNIYIDSSKMNIRVFYTAISRACKWEQIKLIV